VASFVNVCRFTAVSSGTGDFVVSTAVTGYQTPALAGAVNAAVYRYRAESNDLSEWEVGYGAYTSGTTTLARTTVLYNSAGTGTGSGQSGAGSKISFSAAPQVAVVFLAEDAFLGTTGSTDNAAIRADGTGGLTMQASPLIIADTTGALSRSGDGGIPVQGTNTNASPAAGNIGEYVTGTLAYGSKTSLVSTTAKTVISISLSAGDWDVRASGFFEAANTTVPNTMQATISLTNNTLNQTEGKWITFTTTAAASGATDYGFAIPPSQLLLSSTTTVYLTVYSSFTVAGMTAWGNINARRAS
jgi:hypothetical protein